MTMAAAMSGPLAASFEFGSVFAAVLAIFESSSHMYFLLVE